ncbi:MAG TPA: cytochrome c [Blastocatellia bacterium]
MRKQSLFVSLSTLLLALLAGLALVLGVARSGLMPIQADAAPSALETRFFTMAVRASVARHAAVESQADALANEDIESGAEIYKTLCAQCHGQLNGKPSVLGASFYPPAPQLPGHSLAYSDAEVFWIVKHGIRNTAMPAWRSLLSDDDIKKVVAFVKRLDAQSKITEAKRDSATASTAP